MTERRGMSKTKTVTLFSGSEGKQHWSVVVVITKIGNFQGKGTILTDCSYEDISEKRKRRGYIRIKDREWVYRNIPSTIAWKTQIHHDWEDGARMYLLSKGEHILRERREK